MTNFANKIREIRVALKLNQTDFSKKLGLKTAAISKWENSLTTPDIEAINKLFLIFNVNPNWFFLDDGEMLRTQKIRSFYSILSDFEEFFEHEKRSSKFFNHFIMLLSSSRQKMLFYFYAIVVNLTNKSNLREQIEHMIYNLSEYHQYAKVFPVLEIEKTLLKDFFTNLDTETLEWIFDNKKMLKIIIEKETNKYDFKLIDTLVKKTN